MQFTLTHLQAQSLIEVLGDNIDGEDVLLAMYGPGEAFHGLRRSRELSVAFDLKTFTIDEAGEVSE